MLLVGRVIGHHSIIYLRLGPAAFRETDYRIQGLIETSCLKEDLRFGGLEREALPEAT